MRKIPIQLIDSLNQPASTMTRGLKITLRNGYSYGLCMSNADVRYDDGDGEIVYSGTNSFDPSMFSSDINYSVDNAEGYALISKDLEGITLDMVNSGALDDASWICYYFDYRNPQPGSAIILDAGDIGEVKTKYGMVWIPELLSYAMRLRQPVGDVYSRTCRAEFGSPANSQHGCGVDFSSMWIDFTVSETGAENDRVFVVSGLVPGVHPLYPGRIEWSEGDNAGQEFATESVVISTSGAEITMNETSSYAIAVGDKGRIRPDCLKTEANCLAYDNYINMKAEPLIPVGDTASIATPGADL